MTEYRVQIDAKRKMDIPQIPGWMQCVLYTGDVAVNIYMHVSEYQYLVESGFFIRDGKTLDSANVLNTTLTYTLDAEEKKFLKKKGGNK